MRIINHKNFVSQTMVLMLFLTLAIFSCKKQELIGEDPYAGGKQPLGIKFSADVPDPEIGTQGGEVNVNVRGLLKYKDKFKFLINEVEATVLALTDSTIRVKIPDNASTGGFSVMLDGQTFFGPNFTIDGKVSLDGSFLAVNGSNGSIYDILKLPTSNYFLGGSFTDFDNKATAKVPIGGVAQITAQGAYASTLNFGKGANGVVYSVNRLPNGQYIIAGLFGNFNNRKNINSITRLNSDGTLDSTIIQVINPTPLEIRKNVDTVPTFNGGVDGVIRKTFVQNNMITIVGTFQYYARYFYERSTYDNKVLDATRMRQLVRVKIDGTMDSTFNFDPAVRQSYAGGNGAINDAFMQPDGKIVIVGSFTTFNGSPANHIARINTDGTLDASFNAGAGTNDDITSITYNSVTQKIIISGLFNSYNGTSRSGVAMLNANGSIDNSFSFSNLSGGVPTFASQLDNGKIIVSGQFNKYNDVVRQGFMVLNADGKLASGYNNSGAFQGQIYRMVETTSSLGNPAVILTGFISKFDNKKVGNIVRVELKP
ncbi:DUF5008 domain-containing protein [Pedobacter punctiformis]|uniref:DUF5008 domain-containing protein n=1 Tax=Pedobacter punctiformis TaxID=3004097 RepID=A0ABT4LAX9_9SPHI|nr:DUF5008 domain-containing protein [Pedobacter sp. HCMS5-2]MCZ4244862.1 DUF5008 domain-containing protein [Pedobacter sp. HCMS5-2]